jgi:hypothetical protein
MTDDPDYILEIGGREISPKPSEENEAANASGGGRPFISVHFECCGVYSRIYKNREGTAYVGWCPKCARKVSVKIGEGGVNCRLFRAG